MAKKLELDPSKVARLNEIRKLGLDPFPFTFNQTHHAQEVNEKFARLDKGEHTEEKVSVAGRLMLKRVMGKASFFHLQDQSGRVQLYLQEDKLGENYRTFTKLVDTGDVLGAEGKVIKTKMGEVTVEVEDMKLLSKSLIIMPEKWHGIKEIELKYRRRYVDLFVNPEVKDIFVKRSKMVKTIRDFFIEKGFMEVETPTLQTIYGGANARPFVTHINTWDMKMYLSISPELYLKRLLVGGFEKVFTICKNFRNEDVDHSHNPEFTMIELYQSYVDYNTMMQYMEQVFEKACVAMNGTTKVKQLYQGEEVILDFKAPWKKMTMIDALKHYANLDVARMPLNHLQTLLEKNNIAWEGELTWGLGVMRLFEELVEEKLVQPVHITDHPLETTPLCKRHRRDSRLIERFESFCLGMELCNAYSELNDPLLQRELLEKQAAQLRGGSEEAHPMDEDFLNSLEYGMPPAGGLGFGIDRMAVLLTGVDSIRDVIFFPTMRPLPEEEENNEAKKEEKRDARKEARKK